MVKRRALLKMAINKCLLCKRFCTELVPPLMGDLPYDRIEVGQPPF